MLAQLGAPLHKLWLASELGTASGSRGRRTQVEIHLRSILAAAVAFHREKGRWPESIQALVDLEEHDSPWHSCNVGLDPWHNHYLYEIVDGAPRVTCLGSDGQTGGDGEAADVLRPLEDHGSRP